MKFKFVYQYHTIELIKLYTGILKTILKLFYDSKSIERHDLNPEDRYS